jgi:putative restriction endonuclease
LRYNLCPDALLLDCHSFPSELSDVDICIGFNEDWSKPKGDGFWRLQYMDKPQEGMTPSKCWLKEKVSFATFDDDLWVLLQNKVWRQKLRDYIVEHKLTDDSWLGKIAAEGLGAIAALLLAA